MATSINLGPLPANQPVPVERSEMRKQLGLGTSSILNATFGQSGAGDITLNLSDQTNPTFSIDLSKTRLVDTTSIRLLNPRKIYLDTNILYTGTLQKETATATGTITATGNARVTITSANFSTSTKFRVISVPVQLNDTPTAWANKVRGALNANEDIIALFNIDGQNREITLTNKRARAQDATLNIALENDTCTGISPALTSVNTQAGTVSSSELISDVYTPTAHIPSFDGTSEIKIVGMLRPDVVLRRHIKEWDPALDGSTADPDGIATGITSAHIQQGAIIPSKISVGGPTWEPDGDTVVIKDLEVQGGQVLIEGRTQGVATLGALTAGTGYANNTYYNITLSKSSGNSNFTTAPKADIVVSGGKVTNVTITDRGNGFNGIDIFLTAASNLIGGTGTGFKVKVATLTAGDNGGRLVLAGVGETGLSSHNSSKSWQLISIGSASPGKFEIQGGAISAAISAETADTGVGLRIDNTTGLVHVVSLRSQGSVSASSFTTSGTAAAPTGTANDFDGIAKSARVWTNSRTFTSKTIGTDATHVAFTFSTNGSANVDFISKIQDSVIVNAMITDADTDDSSKGIATAKIQNKAITSTKLADSISIANTLTVKKLDTTAGNRGLKFEGDATRITANGNDLEIVTPGKISFGTNNATNALVEKASISNAGAFSCASITTSGSIAAKGGISSEGDVVAYSSSDANLKNNIKNIQRPLEKIERLNGVSFTWNSNQTTYSGYDIGIIAQEVEDIFPEIVTTRENGYKAVRYEKLIPLLIECIKELKNKHDELAAKIELL
jgi:hypothetical protein